LRKAIYDRFRITLEESGDVSDKTVLDVGCGSGRYVASYAKLGARLVVGIDLSWKMLDLARKLAHREKVAACCRFLQGDFLEIELSQQFDIVLAMGVFDYVRNPRPFFEKMVSASSGIVIASFPGHSRVRGLLRKWRYKLKNCPVFFYSQKDVEEIVRGTGLKEYRLFFIPHSGTGFIVVGRIG
jgi:2-polyprenyl-3-methyl-5-hydroxy-6-metoxy-1,4-benzoquinol methylase